MDIFATASTLSRLPGISADFSPAIKLSQPCQRLARPSAPGEGFLGDHISSMEISRLDKSGCG